MKQTTLRFEQCASYAAEDFVVSGCNQLVWQWLEKWPNWPSYGAVIVGPEAAGKTHLLHCWQSRSKAGMVNAASEEYQAQPLAIDDADSWISEEAQRALFHLLNQTKEAGQTILLSATTAPASWSVTLKDLRSRLLSLPVWELELPDEILLTSVLSKHFSDQQVTVDPAVIRYIATRSERSFQAIQQIAMHINAYALEQQRPITTALVRNWMDTQR